MLCCFLCDADLDEREVYIGPRNRLLCPDCNRREGVGAERSYVEIRDDPVPVPPDREPYEGDDN